MRLLLWYSEYPPVAQFIDEAPFGFLRGDVERLVKGAARRIRQQVWGTKMIIIALTGWGQEGVHAQSRDAGCNGHLVKPVNLAELEGLLEKIETTERRTHASPGG